MTSVWRPLIGHRRVNRRHDSAGLRVHSTESLDGESRGMFTALVHRRTTMNGPVANGGNCAPQGPATKPS